MRHAFGFETTDEIGAVGDFRTDHGHDHLTPDGGLKCGIDVTGESGADLFTHLMTRGPTTTGRVGHPHPGREM